MALDCQQRSDMWDDAGTWALQSQQDCGIEGRHDGQTSICSPADVQAVLQAFLHMHVQASAANIVVIPAGSSSVVDQSSKESS